MSVETVTPTEAEESTAVEVSGCWPHRDPRGHFCQAHDEDGNPPWHRCRWAPIAQALAEQRAEIISRYEVVADELFHEAHRLGTIYGSDKRDAATRIRSVAR